MINNFFKRNASNVGDWVRFWDNFNYNLYIQILKSKQK